jgi:hypothetical protein
MIPDLMMDLIRDLMMEAVLTSEKSVDNNFTRQYNPEDNSEQKSYCYETPKGETRARFGLYSHMMMMMVIWAS